MNFLTLGSINLHFCATDMQPRNKLEILEKAKLNHPHYCKQQATDLRIFSKCGNQLNLSILFIIINYLFIYLFIAKHKRT